jgi:hypothetical protein
MDPHPEEGGSMTFGIFLALVGLAFSIGVWALVAR